MIKTLWPHYNQAIGKMVLETVKPQIDEIVKQVGNCSQLEVKQFAAYWLHVLLADHCKLVLSIAEFHNLHATSQATIIQASYFCSIPLWKQLTLS